MSDFNIQFEENDQHITLDFKEAIGTVQSVNGKIGDVVLDAGDLEYDDTETYSSGSVGDELSTLKEDFDDLADRVTALEQGSGSGLTEDIKQALLQIARKVIYLDSDSPTYYNDLYDALYPPAVLVSISAVYTQSGTVYDTDSLDSLKDDLVVTAHYSDSTSQTVADYTLSGTLAEGTSTITVTYSGKTSTFNVTVSVGYSVTNTLTNCSNTNAESKVVKGATYSGGLSADIGYELDTVSVTMGGSDITSTAYSDGAITVANVTGNIVINAVAVVTPVYTSSTGKEYTKNFTYDGPISQFWSTYGTMDELEELTLTGRFYWTGSGAGTSNIGTYAPKLRKFVMAPTSASGSSTEYFKFAHYAFSGIPATLTYLQLGSINPNVYCMVNSAYFRNDGVSAGLPSNNIIGNTNGIEIVMYSNQYRVNGGFLDTVDANTTIKQYLYTDGSVLTA